MVSRFLTGVLAQEGPVVAMVIESACWLRRLRAGSRVRVLVPASLRWASAV